MKPNIFPFLRYDDAPAAIAFLCRAFGFKEVAVHRGEKNTIDHAVLELGPGRIMLSSVRESPLGMKTVAQAGGATQGVYIHLTDVDAHHARAVAAGAAIVHPLEDMPYGSREYSARDPEGNLWSFGTYYPGT